MAKNSPHLSDFLLFAQNLHALQKELLTDATACSEFLVRLSDKRKLSLEGTDDLLIDLADIFFLCHGTQASLCQLKLDINLVLAI